MARSSPSTNTVGPFSALQNHLGDQPPLRFYIFDLMILARLLYAASVRAGFSPALREVVFARFGSHGIDKCPFANLPNRARGDGARVSRPRT
jgi:hypothetical protein